MEFSAVTVALLAICLSCLLLFRKGKGQGTGGRLPPGPRPLPIVGNLFQLDPKNMVKSLLALRERYGSVYTVYLGSQPFVVLCGYQAVKEALVDRGEDFGGRGDFPALFRFTQGDGIVFANGEKWKVLRRFALQTLRHLGMGRRSLEERIQAEAQCVVEELAKTKDGNSAIPQAREDDTIFCVLFSMFHGVPDEVEPIDATSLISRAVSNTICSIIFGDRFDYEDQKFLALVGLMIDNFHLLSSCWGQMYNVFPRFMSYLPAPQKRYFKNLEKLRLFILDMVKVHQETLDPSFPRDFMDCFLLEMQQEKEDPLTYFHVNSLVMTTHNLFFAGTETTSTALRYGILILLKYPEMQAKVYKEILRVVGPHRSPSLEDRVHLPYTDAVIHEILRFADVVPMGLPHAVTRDAHFHGYVIPKGTNILPLLYSVHKDIAQFQNPETFDPSNFLDEDGVFRRHDAFAPFSAGKRACLGQALARMEMFLFLTTLVQRFALQPVVPPEEIDLSPLTSNVGNIPRPYEFRAVPR